MAPKPANRRPADTAQRHVTILQNGPIAVFDPTPDWMEDCIQVEHRVTRPGGPYGYTAIVERVAFGDRDIKGRLAVPTTLLPRLAGELKRRGYEVKQREIAAVAPVEPRIDSTMNEVLVTAISGWPRGRIETTSREEIVDHMDDLFRMFAGANVVVCVGRFETGQWLHEKLAAVGVTTRWSPKSRKLAFGPRQICLYGSLGKTEPMWLEDGPDTEPVRRGWDVLLLVDPDVFFNNEMATQSLALWNTIGRCYTLLASGWTPAWGGELRAEAYLGPRLVTRSPKVGPVQVAWLPSVSRPRVMPSRTLDAKRELLWNNAPRNDRIAAVARTVLRAEPRELRQLGLPSWGDGFEFRHADHPRVAVLVESSEHAETIASRLPDWDCFVAKPAESVTREARVDNPVVLTVSAAAKLTVDVDVLVIASGTIPHETLGRWPTRDALDSRPALLIDFLDDVQEPEILSPRTRAADYEKLGWKQFDCPRG